MSPRKCALTLAAAAALTVAAAAQASYLPPAVVARASLSDPNLLLPNGSTINSSNINLNDSRELAVRVNTLQAGGSGVLLADYAPAIFGGSATGGIALNADNTFSADVGLNNLGTVAGLELIGFNNTRIWARDAGGPQQQLNFPLGGSDISGLTLTDGGHLGGRINFSSGRVLGTFPQQTSGSPALTSYIVDTGVDASSPYSFLFVPSLARDGGVMGTKVQRTAGAGGGDQILRAFAGGSAETIATTASGDPNSNFQSFFNSVGISPDGSKVTFLGRIVGDSASRLFLYDAGDGSITEIAVAGQGPTTTLDVFVPGVNDFGHVAFRGNDADGNNSVFVWDGGGITRVAGVGDLIQTDLGLVELGRRDGQSSQSGGPYINNLGDVGFIFQYFYPDDPSSNAAGNLVMVSAIPEPATAGLLLGAALLGLRRRR